MEEDRLCKLVALAGELAASAHEPAGYEYKASEALTGLVAAPVLARVFAFLGIGSAPGRVCRRWRCVGASPALWEQLARRAWRRAAVLGARRRGATDVARREVAALEDARRALGATPGAACAALRDGMAAAARRARRPPTAVEFAVLDACCRVIDRPGGGASAFRAALDGDKCAGAPPGKLAFALRQLDVVGLSLGADADAHERLYALAVATSSPTFPAAAAATASNVQLGRLASWCVAAANCRDRLVVATEADAVADFANKSANSDCAGDGFDAPPGEAAGLCERAVRTWLQLCAAPPKSIEATASPAGRRSLAQRYAKPSPAKRRLKSASQPPPPSPTLLALFAAEKRPMGGVHSPPGGKEHPRRGADCAATLRRFYGRHNPALVPRAAAIAREWRGSEPTLFALLRYKYKGASKHPPAIAAALDDAERSEASKAQRQRASDRRRSLSTRPTDAASVRQTKRSSSARPAPCSDAPPPQGGKTAREVALGKLKSEIDRLKSSVSRANEESSRHKSRAAAAAATMRHLKCERDRARETNDEELARLRREAADLKRETELRDSELEALREALDTERRDKKEKMAAAAAAAAPPPVDHERKPPPATRLARSPLRMGRKSVRAPKCGGGGDENDSGNGTRAADLAVDAVLAAVVDVLLAEAATELDFEEEFGLSEAQLLGLAPMPDDLPPPPPRDHARSFARSPGTPARKTRSTSPTRVMPLIELDDVDDVDDDSPRTASTRTPPCLGDLEDNLKTLTSALTPKTAQLVLDGLEDDLAALCA